MPTMDMRAPMSLLPLRLDGVTFAVGARRIIDRVSLTIETGPRTVIVTTAVMTVLILIFVEVLPKTLAIARTDRFALTVATPVRYVVFLLAPVVNAVQYLVWRVLAVFGVRQPAVQPLHDGLATGDALIRIAKAKPSRGTWPANWATVRNQKRKN